MKVMLLWLRSRWPLDLPFLDDLRCKLAFLLFLKLCRGILKVGKLLALFQELLNILVVSIGDNSGDVVVTGPVSLFERLGLGFEKAFGPTVRHLSLSITANLVPNSLLTLEPLSLDSP
jgi:hypothetical protein